MPSNGTTCPEQRRGVRIAVQRSGRLAEGSLNLLRNMGLQFETYQDRLFASCRNLPVDILFLRDDDIPEYVQDGVAELGIVGQNVLEEDEAKVDRLLPLDFGYCTLAIAVPEQRTWTTPQDLQGKCIATTSPVTLRRFLAAQGIAAEVIVLRGCVEVAPVLDIADAICDLVSTGSTLRMNRLRTIATVAKSQAVLIGTRTLSAEKRSFVEKLLLRARGEEEAKRYKYVMFNAPESALPKVQALVPGCKSPSVIRLAEPGFVAVHSVVLEEEFWEVVEKIRACGGSGILVTPIEKFIR